MGSTLRPPRRPASVPLRRPFRRRQPSWLASPPAPTLERRSERLYQDVGHESGQQHIWAVPLTELRLGGSRRRAAPARAWRQPPRRPLGLAVRRGGGSRRVGREGPRTGAGVAWAARPGRRGRWGRSAGGGGGGRGVGRSCSTPSCTPCVRVSVLAWVLLVAAWLRPLGSVRLPCYRADVHKNDHHLPFPIGLVYFSSCCTLASTMCVCAFMRASILFFMSRVYPDFNSHPWSTCLLLDLSLSLVC